MTSEAEALPVVIPLDQLSTEAIQGIIEAFVLEEGTEYGASEVPLSTKVAQVRAQLERGEALIVFFPQDESCQIVSSKGWK